MQYRDHIKMAGGQQAEPNAEGIKTRRGGRQWLYGPASAAMMLAYASPALAEDVYLIFDKGFIGRTGADAQTADDVMTLGTLSVQMISIVQDTDDGRFGGSQSNDYTADIMIREYDGNEIIIPGHITWQDGTDPTHGVGFTPSSATAYQIGYPGQSGTEYYRIDGGSNYLFQFSSSNRNYVDGESYSGSVADSDIFTTLNSYVVSDNGGFLVSKSSASVSEAGTTDSFDVVLTSAPTSNVVLTVAASDTSEARVDKTTLTFTPQNWDVPQTVTITGQDDTQEDGNISSTVTLAVDDAASDSDYAEVPDRTVYVTTIDDDSSGDTTAPTITGPSGQPGDATSANAVNENQVSAGSFSANETVTWSITGGEDAGLFNINPNTGALSFNSAPDYENPADGASAGPNTYIVQISATDTADNTSSQTLTVTVQDVDESSGDTTAPAITGPSGQPGDATSANSVNENQVSAGSFSANETVTWSITGGEDAGLFNINPSTGALSFNSAPDYENPTDGPHLGSNTYAVEVTATDSNDNSSTQSVIVSVTDVDEDAPIIDGPNSPSGSSTDQMTVNEGQTSVWTYGANEPVTWSLSGGQDMSAFAIDRDTGALSFISPPDFENPSDGPANGANTYIAEITATDGAGHETRQTLTVTVQNVDENAPRITGLSGGEGDASSRKTVPEGETVLGSFSANEPVTWSISGGEDLAAFQIDDQTGALQFRTAPDYENPTDGASQGLNTYLVEVSAEDASGAISTQSVTITVTDVDEEAPIIEGPSGAPGASESVVSVVENTTAVTALQANEAVAWEISGGEDAASFTIDEQTGALSFNTAPDFEAPSDGQTDGFNTYIVEVTATDGNDNTSAQTVTVTVTDADESAPIITGPSGQPGDSASTHSVVEGQTAAANFTANEAVTWSLADGQDISAFDIDPNTGAMTFRSAPDFENPTDGPEQGSNSYIVQVAATDGDNNTSYQTVTIEVTDRDEDAPLITGPDGTEGNAESAIAITEGQTEIHDYRASEPVTWSVSGGQDANAFLIDTNTGALTFRAAPDHSQPTDGDEAGTNTYVAIIAAEDGDGNTASQKIIVTVEELDEEPPVIHGPDGQPAGDRYEGNVPEGSSDAAAFGASENVVWAITDGEDAALFVIDPQSGVLSFANTPDYEDPKDGSTEGQNTYLVNISATDASDNTSIQPVMIRVSDIDDPAPTIDPPGGDSGIGESELTIVEGRNTVGVFSADGPVAWSVVGGEDADEFLIDRDTGELMFITAPDFDAPRDGPQDGPNSYLVDIRATAPAGSHSTQQVTVRVTSASAEIARLFEEDQDQIEAIIRSSAKADLRNSLSGHRKMTNDARRRFIDAQDTYEGCHGGQTKFNDPLYGAFGEGCTGIVGRNNVPFDVTGFAELTLGGVRSSGDFYGQRGNFEGSKRRIVSGNYSIIQQDGIKTLSVNARMAREYTVSSDLMWGVFGAGSIQDTQIAQSDYEGAGDALSLSFGGYMVRKLTEDLFLDGFAAIEGGHNNLEIASDDLSLEGTYYTFSAQVGGSLSGPLRYNHHEIWPKLSFAYGRTAISDAKFDATIAEGEAAAQMPVRHVEMGSLSFAPELRKSFGEDERSSLTVTPRLSCEIVEGDVSCGHGIAIGLKDQNPNGLESFSADIESDTIGDIDSYRFNIGRQIRF